MQRGLQAAVLSAGLVTMAACGSSISTDYIPSVSFAQVHTFALVTPRDRASHQLLDDIVRSAVDSVLRASTSESPVPPAPWPPAAPGRTHPVSP
jgi:hypothetical protein